MAAEPELVWGASAPRLQLFFRSGEPLRVCKQEKRNPGVVVGSAEKTSAILRGCEGTGQPCGHLGECSGQKSEQKCLVCLERRGVPATRSGCSQSAAPGTSLTDLADLHSCEDFDFSTAFASMSV